MTEHTKVLSDSSRITVSVVDGEYIIQYHGSQASLYVDDVRRMYNIQTGYAGMTFAEFLARTIDGEA